MKIIFEKLRWKNFLSYGDEFSEIEFIEGIDLAIGSNGRGKCLRKNTIIEVSVEDKEIEEKLKGFLNERNKR